MLSFLEKLTASDPQELTKTPEPDEIARMDENLFSVNVIENLPVGSPSWKFLSDLSFALFILNQKRKIEPRFQRKLSDD